MEKAILARCECEVDNGVEICLDRSHVESEPAKSLRDALRVVRAGWVVGISGCKDGERCRIEAPDQQTGAGDHGAIRSDGRLGGP